MKTLIGSAQNGVLGPVAIAFWPWSAEAATLATLRSAIAGAPDSTAVVLPENALASELVAQLPPRDRDRVSHAGEDGDAGLRAFLDRAAAAHPRADLAVVADAGVLPTGWLAELWAAAHVDDTVAIGTARATGGGAATLAAVELPGPDASVDGVAPGEHGSPAGPARPGPRVPRVLLPEPSACVIRRSAFDLLGGLGQGLRHPEALLADFAARGRELGLSCALAADTIIRRCAGGLDPCPPVERERLERRHPWLRAARADERALDPGPLKHSLVATRASRRGLSVTVDARSLGSGFGGTRTYVGALVLALARSGAVSVRAVVSGEPEPELQEEWTASGVEIVDYEDAARGALPRTDVIHRPQQVFTPSDLRLLQLVGERLVVTHMDLIAYRAPTYHDSVDAWRAYRRTSRLALAAADQVIFLSEHARRDALAEELVPVDRAVVAGIGVAPALRVADGDRPARVPPGTDLLLMLGADYAHKNRPFAISLLGELVRRHGWPGVLVLAGAHVPRGSSAEAEAELLAARPDLAAKVIDLGPVSEAEKRWLLRSAAAHLAPSTYEGFGLAPLEAAAAGRPCIYAARGPLAEIIDPAAAIIVPWDPAATADGAMELLRAGPARERHLGLLAEALHHHTWDGVIPRILAAYEEAVASPCRASAPRAWAELEREELAADLLARVADGMALIDTRGPLLTPAQQRGLMRVAVRPWLKAPLLGGFGLLGLDHREARGRRPALGRARAGARAGRRRARRLGTIGPMPTHDRTPDGEAQPSPALAPKAARRYTRWERIMLTYRYHGGRSLIYRALTLPLRFTPLRSRVTRGSGRPASWAAAARWYRAEGRPVTIVIPSYRDYPELATLIESLRATTRRDRVRIVVCDDASGPDHLAALGTLEGIEVVAGECTVGFAANVNRGLAAADPRHDVVLLNSDTIARRGWLERLQYAAGGDEKVGIVGGKLLYPDGRIQFAGTVRNLGAPEWFDHRYRFKPSGWGPANVPQPVTAVSGACMYLKRTLLDAVGGFDPDYPMAYEDVDLCLRAWEAGFKVLYWPDAELTHLESVSRGTEVGERERASQRRFWARWGDFFDARDVRTATGALRVVYVTEDTGVGGGHRDIFEHLNRLLDRGHEVELWSLGAPPEWFELRAPVRTFADYDALADALAPLKAIKVATWWTTASPVWRASVLEGIPVFFVQDIETSYYAGNAALQNIVLSWYRPEFRYMTISSWNRDRLRELGLDAVLIPPGIDRENFRPLPEVARRTEMVLAIGRTNPLKNLPLTIAAWRALPEPRPELCLFGIEPELAGEPGIRYVNSPSDDEVNRLFNEATVFLQTSTHEGFCLPALESMATGGAVVCTDAHGNRDFCRDGENCLMPAPDQQAVTAALRRLLGDPELRERLGTAGIATASEYGWALRIDELERFLNEVATPRRIAPSSDAVPGARPGLTGSPRRTVPSG